MPTGNVKWFDSKKGFGFIISPEGKDVFVHFSSIEGDGFRSLKDGEKVDYEQIQGEKGLLAQHVKRVVAAAAAAAAAKSASSSAQPRSAQIIIALRGNRSAAAPASSPSSRYGSASRPTTAAVNVGEPLLW